MSSHSRMLSPGRHQHVQPLPLAQSWWTLGATGCTSGATRWTLGVRLGAPRSTAAREGCDSRWQEKGTGGGISQNKREGRGRLALAAADEIAEGLGDELVAVHLLEVLEDLHDIAVDGGG
eukprot:5414114-Pyramimonas_sp.AAC.1